MGKSFITIGFVKRGRALQAEQPKISKTADAAIALAQRMADSKAGAVAFEQSHDAETDSYDEPVVLFKTGELPPDFSEG